MDRAIATCFGMTTIGLRAVLGLRTSPSVVEVQITTMRLWLGATNQIDKLKIKK